LLWRHCHTENCEVHDRHAHGHDQGRSGALIMVGDTIHNFVDDPAPFGLSRAQALAVNLLSSVATPRNGKRRSSGFIGASMVYVAVADLIPGLHRRPELRDSAFQPLLIALGIGSIAAVRLLLAH
jgi:zinc and cadmium transporter